MRATSSCKAILVAAMLLAAAGSRAQDDAPAVDVDSWQARFGFGLQSLCLAQDAAYEHTPFGRSVAAMPDFPGWRAIETLPWNRCARERQYIAKAACEDAMKTLGTGSAGTPPNDLVEDFLHRHRELIPQVPDVMAFGPGTSPNCPATLQDHSTKSR